MSAEATSKILLLATDPLATAATISKLGESFPELRVEIIASAAIPPAATSNQTVLAIIPVTGWRFYRQMLKMAATTRFKGYDAIVVMYGAFPLVLLSLAFRISPRLVCNGTEPPISLRRASFREALLPVHRLSDEARMSRERLGLLLIDWQSIFVTFYRGTMRKNYHQVADGLVEVCRYPYFIFSGWLSGRGRHYVHQVLVGLRWTSNKILSLIIGALEGTVVRYADETAGLSKGLWTRLSSAIRRFIRRLPRLAFEKWKQLLRLLAFPPAVALLIFTVCALYLKRKIHELLDV